MSMNESMRVICTGSMVQRRHRWSLGGYGRHQDTTATAAVTNLVAKYE